MTDKLPPCPWCHTSRKVYPHGEREFFCGGCKRLFDLEKDGDVPYGDPAKIAERRERKEKR